MAASERNKTLQALLILFDRYVLTEKNGKFQFRGEIFEYHFTCEVPEAELVQKIGEFLATIPKYLWNLKRRTCKTEEK